MPTHYYRTCGLRVASSLVCPNLLPSDGTSTDVSWRIASVPEALEAPDSATEFYQVSSGDFLLTIDGVARYLVRNGREILVEPCGEVDDDVVAYLLGSAMGALLHQRGVLPLHGSAIEAHGEGIVFVGPAGIGKSTLTASLRNRGYRVLSDDVCVVSLTDNAEPTLLPGNPFMRICGDIAGELGQNTTGLHRNPWGKYVLPIQGGFTAEPVRMTRLYSLQVGHHSEPGVAVLEGFGKVSTLLENTYRSPLVLALGGTATHFEQCVRISKRIQVRAATRAESLAAVSQFVDLIESDFLESAERAPKREDAQWNS